MKKAKTTQDQTNAKNWSKLRKYLAALKKKQLKHIDNENSRQKAKREEIIRELACKKFIFCLLDPDRQLIEHNVKSMLSIFIDSDFTKLDIFRIYAELLVQTTEYSDDLRERNEVYILTLNNFESLTDTYKQLKPFLEKLTLNKDQELFNLRVKLDDVVRSFTQNYGYRITDASIKKYRFFCSPLNGWDDIIDIREERFASLFTGLE